MKRFNFTGRKKILRDDIKVRLHADFSDTPIADVFVDLADYDFPSDATVYIEPQQKTRFMRIPLGGVVPSLRKNGIQLQEFDDADALKFRIKVVDEAHGLLLGIAENVKPYDKNDELDKNQQSILPVLSVDLSSYGVLWRIGWGDQRAVLEIERRLGSRDQVVRSMLFRGFILPAAMRQILEKITSEEWDTDLTDPDELSTRWLLFARQLGAGLPDPDADDHEEWMDNAVRLLAAIIGVRSHVIDDFAAGAWK